MSCPIRKNEDLLLGYVAGKLEPRQANEFEAHLRDCSACREAAAAQQAVSRALDAWSVPVVSADFDRRLHARIGAEVSWWDAMLRRFRPVLHWRAVPVAATAGLLLMAGLLLRSPGTLTVPDVPVTAQVEAVEPDQAENALVEMEAIREFSSLVRADTASPRM